MPEIHPFRGLRYDPGKISLADVLAPPYDVISEQLQADLYSRALQNVVRIELGRGYEGDRPGESDRYLRARDHVRVWVEQGFLVRDSKPSLYLHRHEFTAPDGAGRLQRLGFFGAVEPVAYDRREVLRHELTMREPREDRLRLLLTSGVQTSPILLAFEDAGEVGATLERQMASAQLVGSASVDWGAGEEAHELWRVQDPEVIASITDPLRDSRLFIADGHHRYETALGLHLPGVLALLAPLQSSATLVLPTHRVVPQSGLRSDDLMTALVGAGWAAEPIADTRSGLEKIAEMRGSRHAFVIFDSGTKWVVSRRRQAPSGEAKSPQLDVSVLNREILEGQLGLAEEDLDRGRVLYTRELSQAEDLVRTLGSVGFLVNAPTVAEMREVAMTGGTMPPKSTYFFPKVPAGLVMLPNQ